MHNLPSWTRRSLLTGSGLAIAVAMGWGCFAYMAFSSSRQVSALTAERNAAIAEHQKLQEAAGQLAQVEAKLGSARVEYGRVVQAWAEVRERIGQAQQNLAALNKRQELAGDRVTQTGSIRPAEPPKRPAATPSR